MTQANENCLTVKKTLQLVYYLFSFRSYFARNGWTALSQIAIELNYYLKFDVVRKEMDIPT